MFRVQVQQAVNRIVIQLTGFATLDDVARFRRDLDAAFEALSHHGSQHQFLYDASEARIQSQEVVEALRALVLRSPRSDAFALVNASALAGRQLGRIFADVKLRTFGNLQEATVWLDHIPIEGGLTIAAADVSDRNREQVQAMTESFRVRCPSCGEIGALETEAGIAANDDERHTSLRAPEGFRKVQVGWNSDKINLYCVKCGIAAVRFTS